MASILGAGNVASVENDIEDMYYSPPVQPQQPVHFNEVINPVVRDLGEAQAELGAIAAAGKFPCESVT